VDADPRKSPLADPPHRTAFAIAQRTVVRRRSLAIRTTQTSRPTGHEDPQRAEAV